MALQAGQLRTFPNSGRFVDRLREISMFFDGSDRVHQAMRRVASRLQEQGIKYAIVGGMAVNAHRHQRTTKDVDFLLSPQGLTQFRRLAEAGEFDLAPGRSRRFIDRETGVSFDVLVAGAFPGSGDPGPIAFPDPEKVSQEMDGLRVVDLPTLIQLKLAAGRYQDFADVVNLISANSLNEDFAQSLHSSIRGDYIECLEEMRRESEYEARQDRAADPPTDNASQP